MRRIAGLALAGLVGLGTVLAAQERPGGQGGSGAKEVRSSWFKRWFAPARKAEEKKPATEVEKKLTVVESAAGLRAREEEAFYRRLAVCLKLQEIALQTGDEKLQRKAEELELMAWHVYTQRTAHLPSGAAGFGVDEDALARQLGPSQGEGQGLTGARPAGNSGVAVRKE
jgi:hypothetical protein